MKFASVNMFVQTRYIIKTLVLYKYGWNTIKGAFKKSKVIHCITLLECIGDVSTKPPFGQCFDAPLKSAQKWRQTIDRFTKFKNGTFYYIFIMRNEVEQFQVSLIHLIYKSTCLIHGINCNIFLNDLKRNQSLSVCERSVAQIVYVSIRV
mgnify:CR=1 FL=1